MRFVCLPHFGYIYTCRSGISPVAVTTNREAATEIAKTVGKDAATLTAIESGNYETTEAEQPAA